MFDDFDIEDTDSQESWQIYFLTLSDPARKNHDFELVKVGITKGAVERRIASLQTGNPYQIRCEAVFTSSQGRAIESWIHRTRDVKHLEWLRLRRSEINSLVEEAKRENERLIQIADAERRWKAIESNGKLRPPCDVSRELHKAMIGVADEIWPTTFELAITLSRLAVLAGKVWRIPGVVQISRRDAFKKFKNELAQDQFPDLVAEHSAPAVQGRLLPKGLPDKGTPRWAALREEAESLERLRRELNVVMLADPNDVVPEGVRTDELAELHDRFLELIGKRARLLIDKQELRARAIQLTEDFDGIDGLWTHKRKQRLKFDAKAFRAAYREAAAACAVPVQPFIHRHVFYSRSY